MLSHRFGRGALIAITLGLAIGSLALNLVGNGLNAERNFVFSPSRFGELGAGSLCALLLPSHGRLRNGALALVGLALILGSVLLYDDHLGIAGYFTILPVAGTVLVILFCRPDTLAGRILSHSAPVGIGLVSYSAYLVHQPLFAFARIRSPGEPSALLMGALCLVTLAYLQGLGVKVLVVGDLPWFASEPASCKYEIFPGSVKYCSTERIDARAAAGLYGPMFERLAAETGVPIVPVRQAFCEAGHCSMVRDGVMQFRDSNHLNVAGSERLGGIVADRVPDDLP